MMKFIKLTRKEDYYDSKTFWINIDYIITITPKGTGSIILLSIPTDRISHYEEVIQEPAEIFSIMHGEIPIK